MLITHDDDVVEGFDLSSMLRRIRRLCDLSQRELAKHLNVSPAAIGSAEAGTRDLPCRVVARAAEMAGFRLVLLDAAGVEVAGMADAAVRDRGRRRFPAHLDTRYVDEGWWHDAHHWSRPQSWYTFDLDRARRDARRGDSGPPADHLVSQPGDSPEERRAARRGKARERAREENQRRLEAGELPELQPFPCECPPECDELDDWSSKPVHAPDCPCGCDLG
jgi:HTH-type transcriptional regulator/antitoxin HipB